MIEVGTTNQGNGKRGCGCPDLGKDLYGGVPGRFSVWVGDLDDDTMHWKVFGRIPLQGGLQAESTVTTEGG